LPPEAGGNEAAGSLAASVSTEHAETGALSSPEDDPLSNGSLEGERLTNPVELPIGDYLPAWWKFAQWAKSTQDQGRCLAVLAHRLRGISLGVEPEVPVGPVVPQGPYCLTLARAPPRPRQTGYGTGGMSAHAAAEAADRGDESKSEGAPPGDDAASAPGSNDGDPPQSDEDGEGGDDDRDAGADDDSDDSEMEDQCTEPAEDPKNAGTGKHYKPQTSRGKSMAKMFRWFCDLSA